MDINSLKYFLVSAEFEHITKASNHLHIAQPALTKSIKNLEDELGVKLFERKGRNVYLTKYGAFLKENLESLLPKLDNLKKEVLELKSLVENTITLNVLSGSSLMTNLVIDFKKIYPDTIFKIIQNKEDKTADITVTTTKKGERAKGKNTLIIQEEITLSLPNNHPLMAKDEITLKDISGKDFIALAGTRHFRAICDKIVKEYGATPKYVFESDSHIAVGNLIESGFGIGFWPKFSWGKLPSKNIALKSLTPKIYREIVFDYNSKNEVAKTFYNFISTQIPKYL